MKCWIFLTSNFLSNRSHFYEIITENLVMTWTSLHETFSLSFKRNFSRFHGIFRLDIFGESSENLPFSRNNLIFTLKRSDFRHLLDFTEDFFWISLECQVEFFHFHEIIWFFTALSNGAVFAIYLVSREISSGYFWRVCGILPFFA